MPRPVVPWSRLMAFGLLLGVGQFSLLFLAMRSSISPGMASLVIQMAGALVLAGLAVIVLWPQLTQQRRVKPATSG